MASFRKPQDMRLIASLLLLFFRRLVHSRCLIGSIGRPMTDHGQSSPKKWRMLSRRLATADPGHTLEVRLNDHRVVKGEETAPIFARDDVAVVEGEYRTNRQPHMPIEPDVGFAYMGGES